MALRLWHARRITNTAGDIRPDLGSTSSHARLSRHCDPHPPPSGALSIARAKRSRIVHVERSSERERGDE